MEFSGTETLLGIGATAMTAMSGAVGVMWKTLMQRTKKTEEKLEQCEVKHESAQKNLLSLTERVGNLEGEMRGYSRAHSEIMAMSDDVKAISETMQAIKESLPG